MPKLFLRIVAFLLVSCLMVDPAMAYPLIKSVNPSPRTDIFSQEAFASRLHWGGELPAFFLPGHYHAMDRQIHVMLSSHSGLPVVYKDALLAQVLANEGWVTGGGVEAKVVQPSSRLKELIPENGENQAQIILNLDGHLICVGVERPSSLSDWDIGYISRRDTMEEYIMGSYYISYPISERIEKLVKEAETTQTEEAKVLLNEARALVEIRHAGNPSRSEIESEFPYYTDLDSYITMVAKAYVEKLNDVDTAFALAKITRQEEHAELWAWLVPEALKRGVLPLSVLQQMQYDVGVWNKVPLWIQIMTAYQEKGLPMLDFRIGDSGGFANSKF